MPESNYPISFDFSKIEKLNFAIGQGAIGTIKVVVYGSFKIV